MNDAREKLQSKIREAIRGQVASMLADPGPYVWKDGADAAEEIAESVVAALVDGDRKDMGGWLLKSYGQFQVLEVVEFDMINTNEFTAYTKEYPDDDE